MQYPRVITCHVTAGHGHSTAREQEAWGKALAGAGNSFEESFSGAAIIEPVASLDSGYPISNHSTHSTQAEKLLWEQALLWGKAHDSTQSDLMACPTSCRTLAWSATGRSPRGGSGQHAARRPVASRAAGCNGLSAETPVAAIECGSHSSRLLLEDADGKQLRLHVDTHLG